MRQKEAIQAATAVDAYIRTLAGDYLFRWLGSKRMIRKLAQIIAKESKPK
jgi:hypothetical protein